MASRRDTKVVEPPAWNRTRLEKDRIAAIDDFREERMKEPLEIYLDQFDAYQHTFETLLETTIDLTKLEEYALDVLTDDKLLEALRYLSGPPISEDDLKVVAEAKSIAPAVLKSDAALTKRIIDAVMMGLDRRRFPWMAIDQDGREATEQERASAVLASAAMIAARRAETERRSEGKNAQEAKVRVALTEHHFKEVKTRLIKRLAEAPSVGEFCGECLLGSRKADIVLRLWDQRVLALECKVSNSSTNSIKRLNNDAAVKAVVWREEFGKTQVVPSAVLSGVYKLRNLETAQEKGLTIFWAHSLAELTKWIDKTKP